MEYKAMLKEAQKDLPESALETQRFEIPKVKGHLQGNMTVISNFAQIASHLRRDPQHLLKYVLKELAAPGSIKPKGLLIGAKVSASKVNEKIKQYAHKYVFCPACGKPDTQLEKDGSVPMIKCSACGHRGAIKGRL